MNENLLVELLQFVKDENLELNMTDDELYEITWRSKLRLKCLECDEVFEISTKQLLRPHPVRTGKICPRCDAERLFLNKLNSTFGRNPYKFKTKFLGYNEPLTVECLDCGFEFTANSARNLVMIHKEGQPHPCRKCANIRNFKTDVSEFEKLLVDKLGACNYEFLEPDDLAGPYSKKKVKVKCKLCGYEFSVNPQNLINPVNGKHYCKECSKLKLTRIRDERKEKIGQATEVTTTVPAEKTAKTIGSTAKADLKEWVKTIYDGEIKFNSKDISEEMPVDIYFPDKKIAVDLCLLRDNDHYNVTKKFHIDRTYVYHNAGVRLIQIFEDEWESNEIVVKEKLTTILGKNTDTVYARKCTVGDITPTDKNIFLKRYHIQGDDRAAFMKALYYEGKVVAVMTFIRPRLALGSKNGSQSGCYELSRYASSRHVVGGFSKLFKEITKDLDANMIKTFADIRWSGLDNNVYVKNGFVQKHISEPNYWYFDTNDSGPDLRRIHRFNFRKQELERKFPNEYNAELTEFQIMDLTSYARIFDCGNLVYEYKLKEETN